MAEILLKEITTGVDIFTPVGKSGNDPTIATFETFERPAGLEFYLRPILLIEGLSTTGAQTFTFTFFYSLISLGKIRVSEVVTKVDASNTLVFVELDPLFLYDAMSLILTCKSSDSADTSVNITVRWQNINGVNVDTLLNAAPLTGDAMAAKILSTPANLIKTEPDGSIDTSPASITVK